MFELKVVAHFAAAHQLKMVAKKCENLHGHNWKIEACVRGKKLSEAGVVMDFGEIKAFLSEILTELDHSFLNDHDFLRNGNPSSENVAFYIAKELQKKIENPSINVSRITAWESENASATYICE